MKFSSLALCLLGFFYIHGQNNLELTYDEPASQWMEALPIGNGFMGAMVYGGVKEEILKLNHDEFWSGEPKDISNPNALAYKDSVAFLVKEERYFEADQLIRNMQGPYSQAYQPLADVHVKFDHKDSIDYVRKLNISESVAEVSYKSKGVTFQRSYFASYPDSIIVARFAADKASALSFELSLSSIVKHKFLSSNQKLVLQLKAAKHAEPNYRSQFSDEEAVQYDDWGGKGTNALIYIIVEQNGGTLSIRNDKVYVKNSDAALVKIISSSSFNGPFNSPSTEGKDYVALADKVENKVRNKNYGNLLSTHKKDYKSLFNRVSLNLGNSNQVITKNTDDRIVDFQNNPDPSLVALLFQYGRYLLISSSRIGTRAANLQGIWSTSTRPPWSSNYTQNINLEMNYWPAEVCNLSELTEPLMNLIRDNAQKGKTIARVNYGLPGWTSHHNGDIWAHCAPVGDYGEGNPVWANWSMGGAWMCQHIWDHYLFTGDLTFLEDHYGLLKGATLFLMNMLDENENGKLETIFGTSPENSFIDPITKKHVSVTRGVAMDLALSNELLANTKKAASILKVDPDFQELLALKIKKLQSFRISEDGILMEWNKDFEEVDPNHRHLSHLYGLYPGNQINVFETPELFLASRNSLEKRGDAATGWSMGWKTNLWARLLDGDHALKIIKNLFTPIAFSEVRMGGGGLYKNMLDAHPPFQIDGNFGVTAGIAEMLLQSHSGFIHVLPALPAEWSEGEVKGLRTRGACTIDLKWSDGKLVQMIVKADKAGPIHIKSEWPLDIESDFNAQLNNPLLQNTIIHEPEVNGSPELAIEIKKYFDYSIVLNAHETIVLNAKP
jgi:alpha-L-fucosidase 2